MLIPPKEPAPNPYEPFVYANQEIRMLGDLGDTYEADVWQTRAGWRWSAQATSVNDLPSGAATDTTPLPTEAEAATAAATWLRRFLPSRVGA